MKRMGQLLSSFLLLFISLFAQAVPGERVTYYHNDVSGSPVAATDANGNLLWTESYQPYGAKVQNSVSTAAQPISYTGKVYDDTTGLSYFGARYYDPVLGRFTGMDSAQFDSGNIHSFNRYAYGNNNPYRYVDPDGNAGIDLTGDTPEEEELEHEQRELQPLSIVPEDRNEPAALQRLEREEESVIISALGAAKAGDVSVTPIPSGYMKPGVAVDMRGAPAGSRTNAAGEKRNGPWFWRQLLGSNPEFFSPLNTVKIRSGTAPTVDRIWIRNFPQHGAFSGDTLIHHHIDQGHIATPLPESVHQGWDKTLHPDQGR